MFGRLLPCVLVLKLAVNTVGHAAITVPAARAVVDDRWCPWCHGQQEFNKGSMAPPPHPCWGTWNGSAQPAPNALITFDGIASDVHPSSSMKDSTGNFWIEQQPQTPMWCPGETKDIRMYIHADHNGVYRWESQQASPGDETESAFANITAWRSFNHDSDTEYYLSKDGVTRVEKDACPGITGEPKPWAPDVEACKTATLAKTTLALPDNLLPGQTVIRWIWYGATKLDDLSRVDGPEPSLFVNCIDVVIGSKEHCEANRRRLMLV